MTIDADAIAAARAVHIEDELARRGVRLRGKVEWDGPCPVCGGTDPFRLGPIGEGAIKLSDNAEITTCLGIGEGIETVLSMRETPEFGPSSPVWAVISAGGLASFPVLAGIECLWIAVDNDKPDENGRQAGIEAALTCSKRWTAAGREVYRVTPNRVGRDVNDVMRNRAAS